MIWRMVRRLEFNGRRIGAVCFLILTLFLTACAGSAAVVEPASFLPTLAPLAYVPSPSATPLTPVPATFTPQAAFVAQNAIGGGIVEGRSSGPTSTPYIPTNTPRPTGAPSATAVGPATPTPTSFPVIGRPPRTFFPTNGGYGQPHLVGNPYRSKLSIHVIRDNHSGIMEFVRVTQPPVIKAVDSLGFMQQVKEVSPNTITIGRFNDKDQQYLGIPEEAARRYVQTHLRQMQLNPWIDFWEGWNEPDPGKQNMGWYARFEQERVREMARHGFKTAIGGFATGVPEMDEFALFVPAIETALQYGGILTLHEYSAPVITNGYGGALPGYPAYPDRGSLTFRYRWYYEEFLIPRGLVIPLVITEAGIDGILGNRPGPSGYGWADFAEYGVNAGWGEDGASAFVNQMAWYDAGVRQDNYVLGFTIFSAGTFGHWNNYNIDSLLDDFTAYAQGQNN
jgi:hypothetical protein